MKDWNVDDFCNLSFFEGGWRLDWGKTFLLGSYDEGLGLLEDQGGERR